MEGMTFLYTATESFDQTTTFNAERFCSGPSCHPDAVLSWEGYIKWSKLTHVVEIVSLDGILNQSLVEPDYNKVEDWDFIHTAGRYQTNLYKCLDYVLRRSKPKNKFNLLTVIINPLQDCHDIQVEDNEFMGYDLLDQEFGNSALTNCGGFDESFLPADLNGYGLIDEYNKAYAIRKRLVTNNPLEHHAHTNVIAVWRHKLLGRKE